MVGASWEEAEAMYCGRAPTQECHMAGALAGRGNTQHCRSMRGAAVHKAQCSSTSQASGREVSHELTNVMVTLCGCNTTDTGRWE